MENTSGWGWMEGMIIKEQLEGVCGARTVLYPSVVADKVVKSLGKRNTSNTDLCRVFPKGKSLLDYLHSYHASAFHGVFIAL